MRRLALLAVLVMSAAATAPASLSWKKTTPSAELTLKLPLEVRHAPVLNDRLYRGEIKVLEAFAVQAADPEDGYAAQPSEFKRLGRWEMQVTYRAGVETPRLISLVRTDYQDSHAAHPNHSLGGVVFDKAANRNLHPLDLLRPDADIKPLDKALCDAARAAKRKRNEGDWDEKADIGFSCPTWRGIHGQDGKLLEGSSPPQITLTRSDVPGRAAGLQFLYSPYDLGAYVEGAYDIVLPLAVFQAALKPEYVQEFAGKPRPVLHDD